MSGRHLLTIWFFFPARDLKRTILTRIAIWSRWFRSTLTPSRNKMSVAFTRRPNYPRRTTRLERIAQLLLTMQKEPAASSEPISNEQNASGLLSILRHAAGSQISDGSAGLTLGKILAGALGLSGPLGIAAGCGRVVCFASTWQQTRRRRPSFGLTPFRSTYRSD